MSLPDYLAAMLQWNERHPGAAAPMKSPANECFPILKNILHGGGCATITVGNEYRMLQRALGFQLRVWDATKITTPSFLALPDDQQPPLLFLLECSTEDEIVAAIQRFLKGAHAEHTVLATCDFIEPDPVAEIQLYLKGLLAIAEKIALREPTPDNPPDPAWDIEADQYCVRAGRTYDYETLTPAVATALIPRLRMALAAGTDLAADFYNLQGPPGEGEITLLEWLLITNWRFPLKRHWFLEWQTRKGQ